jgi:hypothetical protein
VDGQNAVSSPVDPSLRIYDIDYAKALEYTTLMYIDLTSLIPAPKGGEKPLASFEATAFTGTEDELAFCGEVRWFVEDSPQTTVTDVFLPGTGYVAEVRLEGEERYRFSPSSIVLHDDGKTNGTFGPPTNNNKILVGSVIFPKTENPLLADFSNSSRLEESNSLIDLIRAAGRQGQKSLALALMPQQPVEEVKFMSDTDFGEEGLKLIYYASGNNNEPFSSPADIVIDGNWRTIDLRGAPKGSPFITVGDGVTLTLRNITLKGLAAQKDVPNNPDPAAGFEAFASYFHINGDDDVDNTAPMIEVLQGGALVIENGVVIKQNDRIPGERYDNSGVKVRGGGEFTMRGGEISNLAGIAGGNGVSVESSGRFEMSGGTIKDNKSIIGGGVEVNGIFVMNGGTISGNEAMKSGGGVYLNQSGQMTLGSKGIVSGNTAYCEDPGNDGGGGIAVVNPLGIFYINGGTVEDNTAVRGGGIFLSVGACDMSFGTISGNTATTGGGGVYMREGSSFSMDFGAISGNTVTSKDGCGGGVYVEEGTFFMKRGAITGNTLNPQPKAGITEGVTLLEGSGKGCGVYLGEKDGNKIITFTKTAGIIGAIEPRGDWDDTDTQNRYGLAIHRTNSDANEAEEYVISSTKYSELPIAAFFGLTGTDDYKEEALNKIKIGFAVYWDKGDPAKDWFCNRTVGMSDNLEKDVAAGWDVHPQEP